MVSSLYVLISCAIGYLMGSCNPALALAKRRNINLLESGTRNPGTINVAHNMGIPAAIGVFLLDFMKAAIPYWIARLLNPAYAWAGPLAGALAVFGHVFPFWHGFKGGKGLASAVGLMFCTVPLFYALFVAVGSLVVSILTNGSRLAIPAACGLYAIGILLFVGSVSSVVILLAATALVVQRNIDVVKGESAGSEYTAEDLLRKRRS